MNKALKHLRKDPLMKRLIEKYNLPGWNDEHDYFLDLVDSIIGQQLSGKAGDTIIGRFKNLFRNTPTAKKILSASDEKIRSAGMSYAKVDYIKNLSRAVLEKKLDFKELKNLPDEEVIKKLIAIKGIGRWTAEMFLMFSLGREDVFSLGDLGLRNAVADLYHIDRKDFQKIERISQKWKPYRSLACRYLWKSLEND